METDNCCNQIIVIIQNLKTGPGQETIWSQISVLYNLIMEINISSKLGSQQINSANPQICGPSANVTFADLRCVNPIFLWFADLKLPQIHNCIPTFSPFKQRRLLGLFWYRVVQYFLDICGFGIYALIIKICGFTICGLAYLRNFR